MHLTEHMFVDIRFCEEYALSKTDYDILEYMFVQELEGRLESAVEREKEVDVLAEKLKQSSKDHEIEIAISKKKHDQLVGFHLCPRILHQDKPIKLINAHYLAMRTSCFFLLI